MRARWVVAGVLPFLAVAMACIRADAAEARRFSFAYDQPHTTAYGIAADTFANWLLAGWSPKRPVKRWFAEAGDDLAEVEVDGERLSVLAEDLDALASTRASHAVRLLPGFDQYVLGPTTEDRHVLPAPRRAAVSRQSGWISPVVIAGGVVSGTWQRDGGVVRIAWFSEAGRIPTHALDEEVSRLASILGLDLRAEVRADGAAAAPMATGAR